MVVPILRAAPGAGRGGQGSAGARAGRAPSRTVSLRRVLVHMAEEYARHNGHADLLRKGIDGARGL